MCTCRHDELSASCVAIEVRRVHDNISQLIVIPLIVSFLQVKFHALLTSYELISMDTTLLGSVDWQVHSMKVSTG